ncbi:hypothetical protein [Dactylosporangium maewongense]
MTLLPMIGRCVEIVGGELGAQHGNWLESADDRRLVITDVARRWHRLDDGTKARFGLDWKASVAGFTTAYVDDVEGEEAVQAEYEQRQYEITMALIWHRHAARLRADDTVPGCS